MKAGSGQHAVSVATKSLRGPSRCHPRQVACPPLNSDYYYRVIVLLLAKVKMKWMWKQLIVD
jgi:hypothetical protein